MGKISDTSKYTTVTPASGDLIIGTDVSDNNNTKTFTVGSVGIVGGYVKKMEAQSSGDQTTTSTDAQDIVFGGAQSLTDVTLGSDGLVTFVTTGDYFVSADFQVGVNSASTVHLRYLIDDVQVGATISEVLPSSTAETPVSWSFPIKVTDANTELKFQYAVESGGDGGLVEVAVTTTGFNDSSAAGLVVYKKE